MGRVSETKRAFTQAKGGTEILAALREEEEEEKEEKTGFDTCPKG